MKSYKITSLAGWIALSLCLIVSLSACQSPSRPSGVYQGTLLQRAGQTVTQKPVTSTITYSDDTTGQIAVTDEQNQSVMTIPLTNLSSSSVTVSIPGETQGALALTMGQNCYEDSSQDYSLCWSSGKFLVEISGSDGTTLFALTGDQFTGSQLPQWEAPKNFGLADAIQMSLTRGFNTSIEFQQVIQAKKSAQAAYLNLLPHLSLSSALSNLEPTWDSLLGAVGDLAPFLLPSRWDQAKAASAESLAQQDALQLMQADAAAQVEGLAYALEKDEAVIADYQYLISRAQDARAKSNTIEQAGTFPAGSTAHLDELIDSMQLDHSALNEVLQEDKAALAQAMGLFNPDGVTDITFPQEQIPWDQATPLDGDAVAQTALNRSFELAQMDHLIDAAKDLNAGVFFNWLDPEGDPTQNLGFNLIAQVEVDQSQVNQLLLTRQQLQQTVSQTAVTSVDEYNESASEATQIKSAIALNEQRLNTDVAQLVPNSQLNTLDVEAIIQDYLAMAIRQETVRASFRVARSKVDRLLLQGAYLQLSASPTTVSPAKSN